MNTTALCEIFRIGKDGKGGSGKEFREELERHGLIVPSYRRKSGPRTFFSILCEGIQ